MQKKGKPVEIVRKPIIEGSWHGKDAWKLALKRGLGFLGVTLVYLIAGTFFTFDSVWLRILASAIVIVGLAYYQYGAGAVKGEKDASYGENIYARRENGHEVDADRSFHKLKGFFAVLVGCAPFVIFTLIFALLTKPVTYRLSPLPAWTESMMNQTEFGTALAYYTNQQVMSTLDILRVVDRAMLLPFVNISMLWGAEATLWAERLSPLLILLVPIWYGIGYTQGLNLRARINTGIRMGDEKKKRRERKARRQRQRSNKSSERLI